MYYPRMKNNYNCIIFSIILVITLKIIPLKKINLNEIFPIVIISSTIFILLNNFFPKENKINLVSENFNTDSPTGIPISNTNEQSEEEISNELGDVPSDEITDNELNLEFNSKYVLGKFKVKTNLTSYSYGYDTILNSNSSINQLR